MARIGKRAFVAPTLLGALVAAHVSVAATLPVVHERVTVRHLAHGVRVEINSPDPIIPGRPTEVVFFALPNGSTIEQVAGGRPSDPAEWRSDAEQIAAQVRLLRDASPGKNVIVVYLEAGGLSWPSWMRGYSEGAVTVRALLDGLMEELGGRAVLAAHSGGGSVLFHLLDGPGIPRYIDRVALLDADYDYSDAAHDGERLLAWLKEDRTHRLVVLAYDDRTVTYNGKPIVGPDGGTYRATHRMLDRLGRSRPLSRMLWQDFDLYQDANRQVVAAINRNYANRILHSALVGDMNGFLYGVTVGGAGETAWGRLGSPRAFTRYIEPADPQWPDTIPARPLDADTGAGFVRRVCALTAADRDAAVRQAIEAGDIPDFLRAFCLVRVVERDSRGVEHAVAYEVAPDYLAIGSDDDFCRMPMTPTIAFEIAERFGCVLPTRRMVDQIYRASALKLAPRPLVDERDALTTFVQHNAIVEEQRAGAPLGPLVGGQQKDIVQSILLRLHPDRVAIYGWHRLDGAAIQPLTIVHRISYMDYSHGVRLVKRTVTVDGRVMDIAAVLRDPVLSSLLSDEGPLDAAR